MLTPPLTSSCVHIDSTRSHQREASCRDDGERLITMSAIQVRNLIKACPTQLKSFTAPDELKYFDAKTYAQEAEKVHDLYQEAQSLDLSADERCTLHRRLVYAASVLARIIDLYDLNGHNHAKKDVLSRLNTSFHDIAATLNLSPQELQEITLSRL